MPSVGPSLNGLNPWPLQRVYFVNAYDADDRLDALLNPSELAYNVQVLTGKLAPVGWSHPVKMYGGTSEITIPLKLYFSQFYLSYINTAITGSVTRFNTVQSMIDWLMAFAYPTEVGGAPPPLYFFWPEVMDLTVTLDSIHVSATSFNQNMAIKTADVDLQLSTLKRGFKNHADVRDFGLTQFWRESPNDLIGNTSQARDEIDTIIGTGTKLNLGNSKKRGRR